LKEYINSEEVLQDAEKTAEGLPDGVERAELLNAWKSL